MVKEYSSQYRIYYEDTDAGGIVYYANYLKFFERDRTDMLRQNNISQSDLIDKYDLAFVVKDCNISFKKGAKLDNLVTIKTSIKKFGSASIIMNQEMFLDDELLNILEVKIATINIKTKKPIKIPSQIKEKLKNV